MSKIPLNNIRLPYLAMDYAGIGATGATGQHAMVMDLNLGNLLWVFNVPRRACAETPIVADLFRRPMGRGRGYFNAYQK